MKNNTQELKKTTIQLSVRTGLMHRNKSDEAQTRSDYTSYYVGAIHYFIRVALEAQSHLDTQTDNKILLNDVQFRENLQFLTQLAESFCEWLPDYSYAIKQGSDSIENADSVSTSDAPGESTETDGLENLAVQISNVMKNPLLPSKLYNAMSDELSHTIAGFADSPGLILGNLKRQSAKEQTFRKFAF
jgi:hypothetical protein